MLGIEITLEKVNQSWRHGVISVSESTLALVVIVIYPFSFTKPPI